MKPDIFYLFTVKTIKMKNLVDYLVKNSPYSESELKEFTAEQLQNLADSYGYSARKNITTPVFRSEYNQTESVKATITQNSQGSFKIDK